MWKTRGWVGRTWVQSCGERSTPPSQVTWHMRESWKHGTYKRKATSIFVAGTKVTQVVQQKKNINTSHVGNCGARRKPRKKKRLWIPISQGQWVSHWVFSPCAQQGIDGEARQPGLRWWQRDGQHLRQRMLQTMTWWHTMTDWLQGWEFRTSNATGTMIKKKSECHTVGPKIMLKVDKITDPPVLPHKNYFLGDSMRNLCKESRCAKDFWLLYSHSYPSNMNVSRI